MEYASTLQEFFQEFFECIDVPYLILRDQDLLPRKSGFDVDILIRKESRETIISMCQNIAESLDIVMIHNDKKIVLFYLSYDNDQRNWALIDIQTEYRYGENCLVLDDMLAMPELQCVQLIKDVQDARKGRASIEVQRELGVKPYEKKSDILPTRLQKIKRKILGNVFFLHWHVMPFVVVSGPDGVGKTTLLGNITRLFETLPFNITGFHHTNLVKGDKDKKAERNSEKMSIWRKLRRRFTPIVIKRIYGAVAGELQYARKINQAIIKGFYSGTLVFSDRYIYDRAIKMRMHPDKMWVSKITTRLNSKLMRRPTVMIIPTDTPSAIYKRKQELTPEEIVQYYEEMDIITKKCENSAIHKIGVAGRTPEDLAIQATAQILKSLSPLIFYLIGTYEKTVKS